MLGVAGLASIGLFLHSLLLGSSRLAVLCGGNGYIRHGAYLLGYVATWLPTYNCATGWRQCSLLGVIVGLPICLLFVRVRDGGSGLVSTLARFCLASIMPPSTFVALCTAGVGCIAVAG